MGLSRIVRNAALGVALGLSAISTVPSGYAQAPPAPQDAPVKDDSSEEERKAKEKEEQARKEEQRQQKIKQYMRGVETFKDAKESWEDFQKKLERAKRRNRDTDRLWRGEQDFQKWIKGEMFKRGILYHEQMAPDGNVGAIFDIDDPEQKEGLEARIRTEAGLIAQEPDRFKEKLVFNIGYDAGMVYCNRFPPGQKRRFPWVVYSSKELHGRRFHRGAEVGDLSEDEIENKLTAIGAYAISGNKGVIWGKEMPVAVKNVGGIGGSAAQLYANHERLQEILKGEVTVPEKTTSMVKNSYLSAYLTIARTANGDFGADAQPFAKSMIEHADKAMSDLGYRHEPVEDQDWGFIKDYKLVKTDANE